VLDRASNIEGESRAKLISQPRFEPAILRLTAEGNKNLDALSGVAYKQFGAIHHTSLESRIEFMPTSAGTHSPADMAGCRSVPSPTHFSR
jgi:hypothetical protein